MPTVRHRDMVAIDRFLRKLYRHRHPDRLAEWLVTSVSQLVDSDQTTWNHVVPSIPRADVLAYPEADQHRMREAALSRHIREHPLLVHYWRTGDTAAHKLSDFVDEAQYHRSPLFNELYEPLGYEDQFVVYLHPPAAQTVALVLARGSRSFTERDRAVLDILRPHLACAWRNAQALHRLSRRLERHVAVGPRCARITLRRDRSILHYPARARRWIYAYFNDLPRRPHRLPDQIDRWVAAWTHRCEPLAVMRGRRRLLLRPDPQTMTIWLEEQPAPSAARQLQALGLTAREAQVLMHVERGRTNLEIAAILGVTASTVKRHLERIFAKLNVRNRTEAAARLRSWDA